MTWLDVIVQLLWILAIIDYSKRLGKAKKEIARLQEELTIQVNENLKLQNNFNTDLVE